VNEIGVENMNHEKLSKRLEQVAVHIPKGSILADIGSDHAYLPCYAVQQGYASKAIAGEVSEGPYQSACKQVNETELQHVIDVRKGDGLDVLKENEATCITIAGMGGALISSILEKGKNKLTKVERLILQPNVGSQIVRQWLLENGWELIDEEILEEDGKIYEILLAEQGDPLIPYVQAKETALLFGPFLMKKRSSVFIRKWTMEKNHWQRIIAEMDQKGQNTALNPKRKELLELICIVEELIKS
jgi:tRNA (adenine22-N1)-methyltransferase